MQASLRTQVTYYVRSQPLESSGFGKFDLKSFYKSTLREIESERVRRKKVFYKVWDKRKFPFAIDPRALMVLRIVFPLPLIPQ